MNRVYYRLIFFIGGVLASGLVLTAQSTTREMVRFDKDFEFEEGFFIDFSQVKKNDPVPFARVITTYDPSDVNFFDKLLSESGLAFFDAYGARQEVKMSDIWGFSRNGVLYKRLSEGFHRVTIVGSICHFVANITTYERRYYDPYRYNPYYYDPYYPNTVTTRNSEMRQYLIDFETGKLLDYDYKSLEVLLMKDPELHDEFMELNKRKKKQLKFFYLRKFNERNPLYLPESKTF